MEKEVYKGNIIQVTEEIINGITWERAYMPDGVIIFPITNEGKILFIEEKRPHENPPVRIKPVSGILEHGKGSPIENAQRELQEEVGLKALNMEPLWSLKSTGTVNSEQHFFIAKNLIPSKLPNPDGEDTILRIIEFTQQELKDMLAKDELRWSLSTLGVFRLFQHLEASR
jgi:8-oxo-dGTP pyrophosphatase MutT (NUDIX family)